MLLCQIKNPVIFSHQDLARREKLSHVEYQLVEEKQDHNDQYQDPYAIKQMDKINSPGSGDWYIHFLFLYNGRFSA